MKYAPNQNIILSKPIRNKFGLNIHENKPGIYFSVYKNGEPVDVEKAPRL